MVKTQQNDPQFLKIPLKNPTLDSIRNLGRHSIIKCPSESCGYEGRSDNVNRHFKRKHLHSQMVTPKDKQVPPMPEALKH